MEYEIEFLPVGNGDKSGDAILVRYKDGDNHKIIVIDGGTKESGEKLVNHIKEYYHTSFVDYVLNTHPDQDHASGLSVVLENLEIGELWIHRPWEYTKEIIGHFSDGRITEDSLRKRLQNSFSYAYPLEEIAKKKNIIIKEPFQGEKVGIFEVLSPHKDWYLYELIPESKKTPQAKGLVSESFESIKDKVLSWIEESFETETLSESGETSADNESSVILYTKIDDRGILLTGDAGVRALSKAYTYKNSISNDLKFIQIPHHGSRRNVSPSVLDNILGEKGQEENKTAFVSASKESTKHPKQSVLNAFIRRGCKISANQGSSLRHKKGMPKREGWSTAENLPFKEKFQE